MSRPKETCPYCKKDFTSLEKHKVCKKRDEALLPHGNTEPDHSKSPQKTTCPYCKKEFTSLEKHKICRKRDEALLAAGNNLTDDNRKEADIGAKGKDEAKSSQKETCPYCKKEFTSLEKHKVCKKRDEASLAAGKTKSDASGKEIDVPTNSLDQAKSPEKATCPYCRKEFKSLEKHKICRKRDEALLAAGNNLTHNNGKEVDIGAIGKDEAKSSQSETCPHCKKEFTSLEKHKICKKRDEALLAVGKTKTDASEKKTDLSANSLDPTKSSKKATCPYCRKEFTSLEKHKICKKRDEAFSTDPNVTTGSLNDSVVDVGELGTCCKVGQALSNINDTPDSNTDKSYHGEALRAACRATGDAQPELQSSDDTNVNDDGRGVTQQKEICPYCKKNFKSLAKHKICRKRDEVLSATEAPEAGFEHVLYAAGGGDSEYYLNASPPQYSSEVTFTKQQGEGRSTDKGFKTCLKSEPDSSEVIYARTETSELLPQAGISGVNQLSEQDIHELNKFVDDIFRAKIVEKSENPKAEVLNFFGKEVKLRKMEMNPASGLFNGLVKDVLKHLKDRTGWDWEQLKSGSYYDGTKVSRPDEMDCMFVPKLKGLEVSTTGAPPGFCLVKIKDSKLPEDLRPFCDGNCLSSSMFRKFVFQCLESFEKRRVTRDTTLGEGSPSFCVSYDTGLNDGNGNLIISMDLVPALHFPGWPMTARVLNTVVPDDKREKIARKGFHVVAKDYSGEDYKNSHLLWRLSFSAAEKILTKHADSVDKDQDRSAETKAPATYRKPVLRILKRVLEIIKDKQDSTTEDTKIGSDVVKALRRAANHVRNCGYLVEEHKFTTFQLRTLMWNEFYVTTLGDHVWGIKSRIPRLSETMKKLKRMLTGRLQMKHFFLPDLDIMADVPRNERKYLYIMVCLAEDILL